MIKSQNSRSQSSPNLWISAWGWSISLLAIDGIFNFISPKSFINSNVPPVTDQITLFFISGAANFIVILAAHLLGVIARPLMILGLSTYFVYYLVNRATFFLVGEFIGWEGLRFIFHNHLDILWLITQVSPWYLLLLAILIICPYLITILMAPPPTAPSGIKNRSGMATFSRRCIQGVLLLIVASLFLARFKQDHLDARALFLLKYRTSPLTTLLFDKKPLDPPPSRDTPVNPPPLTVNHQERISLDAYKTFNHDLLLPAPVIVIIVESLRNDVPGEERIMPNLSALAKDTLSLSAYAPSNMTSASWPAIFTSQYPLRANYHYYYPRHTGETTLKIYDLLKSFGYKTAIFSAQNEQWSGMHNILNSPSLDVFFHSRNQSSGHYIAQTDRGFANFVGQFGLPGKIDDADVAARAAEWLHKNKENNIFIAINFQRSHFPYTWHESHSPILPYRSPDRWAYAPLYAEEVKNAYYNSLNYVDIQIGFILNKLKEYGIYEQSLIMIAGDHGEAFHEKRQTCHGGELIEKTLLTPLIIKLPDGIIKQAPRKTPELLDISPTILDILGLAPHPSFQGESLFSPLTRPKPTFVTVNSTIAEQDAVIYDGWKLIKDFRKNSLYLYKIQDDPGESANLLFIHTKKRRELSSLLMLWRQEQLEYYRNTQKQKLFYPPLFKMNIEPVKNNF